MEKGSLPDWIDDYCEGKLDAERLAEAEAQLLADPELQHWVSIWQELPVAMGSAGSIRQMARMVVRESRPPKRQTGRKIGVFILAILLLVILWLLLQPGKKTDEVVFARYFQPEITAGHVLRGLSAGVNKEGTRSTLLDSLTQFYSNGKYAEAIRIMQTLETDISKEYTSDFYFEMGKLYLLDKRPYEAEQALELVQVGYSNEKSWYLALASLLQGQRDDAVSRLRTIVQTKTHPFRKEAESVLLDLKEKA